MAINNQRRRLAALVLLSTASIVGCGGGDWGYLSGVVKVDGQPVGPGTVILQPVDASRPGAMGFFGEDGEYSIVSSGQERGVRTGEYFVAIEGGEFGNETAEPQEPSKIPPRYGNAATSEIKVTIEPGSQTFNFDLKS